MIWKRAARIVVVLAGAALFAESVRSTGIDPIVAGLGRVGWGFAAIVLLAGAREVVRALAWIRAIEPPHRLRLLPALWARLAGEALNSLLPMGMVVGEPTKAAHVAPDMPFTPALTGLVVEFAFYTASLVPFFGAGVWALVASHAVHIDTYTPWIAAVGIAFALAWLAVQIARRNHRIARGLTFLTRHSDQVAPILACEAAYHALGVAEAYVSLALIAPGSATLAGAFALETANRVVTMVFKVVPMRIGVDEASSAMLAARIGLSPSTGLLLALVRKLRMLVWSAVGLALLAWRPAKVDRRTVQRQAVGVSVAVLTLMIGATAAAQSPTGRVAGTVSIAGPDGQPLVVPGVTLSLTCPGAASTDARVEVSNDQGEFRFVDVVAASSCSIGAELQGFRSAAQTIAVTAGDVTTVTLRLGLDTLREEVTVTAKADGSADHATAGVERVTSQIMQSAPIASERFQAALPLIPGVVRGPDGLLNINGARSNQSALTFNSADGTDPVTGEDAVELPIDAVSSVQVRGEAYAPEFGLSAGAVTTVETQRAGDRWHVTLNDLEPRVRRRGGQFKGIESFTPRATVGGPIVRGRLSLLESAQYELSQTRVFGLPPFESDTKVQGFASFTRADLTLGATNHLTASAMASPRKTTYAGLNTFNPQPVTPDIENHSVLGTVSDQIIVTSSGVLDLQVSVKQFDATISPAVGDGVMVLAPDANAGSYFNDQDRASRRIQSVATYAFSPLGPRHLVKVGAGLARESFDGYSRSRPVEIRGGDGSLLERMAFVGGGELSRSRSTVQAFAQDAWTAGARLTLQYGVRADYDSSVGDANVAPRVSATAVLTADGRTLLRAGLGMFFGTLPLNVASFDQLQDRIVTSDAADGTPLGPAVELTNVVGSDLRVPRSTDGSLELDREWRRNFFVRAGYRQRQNRFEPIVDVAPLATVLRTDGQSRYREGQLSARYQFHGTDQIVGSYTRSSAVGNLNDYNSYFGNLENPVIRADARGPLPWDAPHRWLFWSSLTLPRGFSVFPVLDVRTGFPLSNVDADRRFVGPRDAVGRFPRFVSLDAQVAKTLRLFGHNATVGLKVFNITDHFNPRDYQGNLASRAFGHFDNAVGRTFRGKWIFEF